MEAWPSQPGDPKGVGGFKQRMPMLICLMFESIVHGLGQWAVRAANKVDWNVERADSKYHTIPPQPCVPQRQRFTYSIFNIHDHVAYVQERPNRKRKKDAKPAKPKAKAKSKPKRQPRGKAKSANAKQRAREQQKKEKRKERLRGRTHGGGPFRAFLHERLHGIKGSELIFQEVAAEYRQIKAANGAEYKRLVEIGKGAQEAHREGVARPFGPRASRARVPGAADSSVGVDSIVPWGSSLQDKIGDLKAQLRVKSARQANAERKKRRVPQYSFHMISAA